MVVNVDQCWTMLINVGQCWRCRSMFISVDQCVDQILTNVDHWRSILVSVVHCWCWWMLIQVDQCESIVNDAGQCWSVLISADQYWSMLLRTAKSLKNHWLFVDFESFWGIWGLKSDENIQNPRKSTSEARISRSLGAGGSSNSPGRREREPWHSVFGASRVPGPHRSGNKLCNFWSPGLP